MAASNQPTAPSARKPMTSGMLYLPLDFLAGCNAYYSPKIKVAEAGDF